MLRRLRSAARRAPRRLLAAPLRRFGRGVLLRSDVPGALAQLGLLAAGLAIGLVLALPVGVSERRCPAKGEGYDLCFVQKAVAPSVLIVLASLFLAQFLARALLVRLPAWRRRVREVGERREGREETRTEPPYRSDPFLLASTWGAKDGRSERRRPRLFERAPRLLQRLLRR